MTAAVQSRPMNTEEMLALPANGTERWLIDGELREKPMTVRNRFHSKLMVSVGAVLKNWRDRQPEPRGNVLGGEAGVRLRRNPDLTVGIDVVCVSPELAARQTDETQLIEGVPLLAVEIHLPRDTFGEINEKVRKYQSAGVPLVWVIDPYQRTVTIYQPNTPPCLVNERQELSGDPALPGFRVPLAELFR